MSCGSSCPAPELSETARPVSDASAIRVARKPVNPREIVAASFGGDARVRTFSLMLRLPREQGKMTPALPVDGDKGVCTRATPVVCDRSGDRE